MAALSAGTDKDLGPPNTSSQIIQRRRVGRRTVAVGLFGRWPDPSSEVAYG
jgi:hypothetical protein